MKIVQQHMSGRTHIPLSLSGSKMDPIKTSDAGGMFLCVHNWLTVHHE